jgi:hypothetical protein
MQAKAGVIEMACRGLEKRRLFGERNASVRILHPARVKANLLQDQAGRPPSCL